MTQLEGYRDPEIARRLVAAIRSTVRDTLRVIEFCGGHTHAIMRFGLRDALAPSIEMLSGPGCPVCVTASSDIDQAVSLGSRPDVTLTTFGDLIRVPGSVESLQEARARGNDVRVVYSALDSLQFAREQPEREVVMLGIGFETTAPTVAAAVLQAQREGLRNWSVYSMHKLTAPAMRAILDAGEVAIDAVLGPGHVAAITGWKAWGFMPSEYGVSCTVAGFELNDILQALLLLARDAAAGVTRVSNSYGRGVTEEGNRTAQALMQQVFCRSEAAWRGLGVIPESGLAIAPAFADYDARQRFGLPALPEGPIDAEAQRGCRCGEVLRGIRLPEECPLFGRGCTPVHPVGPCMVSAEGSCAAHYRYRRVAG
ncbi:MAG: hydrogenase formation protein HypD [Anaerolineae bacterium]|jgi:hydrogenase expression/formation protein HypD|nr:hydrogenase formation protein HypD [Chloroflexota bacterium]